MPAERLFFFDVRQGWAPLCRILGEAKVPAVDFPRSHDRETLRESWPRLSRRVLLVAGGTAVAIAVLAVVAWVAATKRA